MKVSICVPIYGVEKYIERCVRSLLEQTYNNIEYVFVNDCTKDNSIKILNKVLSEYPDKTEFVKIISHEKNKGLAEARNTAIENATGDFIVHVDSDDYVSNDLVRKLVTCQEETNSDIVCCNYFEVKDNRFIRINISQNSIKEWKISTISGKGNHSVWGKLIKKSLYDEHNIRAIKGCDNGEDYQVIPILYYYARNISHIIDYLYFYNKENDNSIGSSYSGKRTKQMCESIDYLKNFFSDKEVAYRNAVLVGEAYALSQYSLNCARFGDIKLYTELSNKMKNVNYKQIRELPMQYRIPYLFYSYYIVRLYAQIGHIIKTAKKRFFSNDR